MCLEYSQNFWKIVSRFLGKMPIHAAITYLLLTFMNTFSVLFENRFQNFFKFSSNLHAISSHFNLTFPHNFSVKSLYFFRIFSKVASKFNRKIRQVSIKIYLKCVRIVSKIFSIIFLSSYFVYFPEYLIINY